MRAHWLDESRPGHDAERIDERTLAANGVIYRHVPVDGHEAFLDAFMKEHGYRTRDEIQLHRGTPNLEAIRSKFDKEHLHTDDEVRYLLDGEGIFDIRSNDDRWMRVVVEAGDLISVPKNRNHRFFLTEALAMRCARLFVDDAGWTPHYR